MSFYNLVPESTLDYRDDRDRAGLELRMFLRRIKNQVDAQIAYIHEGNQVNASKPRVELEPHEVRQLILEAARRLVEEDGVIALEG